MSDIYCMHIFKVRYYEKIGIKEVQAEKVLQKVISLLSAYVNLFARRIVIDENFVHVC